jgi:8-oxo-dGTP diphosphatase
MEVLTTIYRQKNIDPNAKTFFREAVRGIIFRNTPPRTAAGSSESPLTASPARKELLMIYSPVNGDYKFPGGGVDVGESHHEALRREIREESGAALTRVTEELGKVVEYAHAIEPDFETFKMTSYYYFCEINGEMGAQNLDDYEANLGFQPVWVAIETALETNKGILAEEKPSPRWVPREIFILSLLLEQSKNSSTLTAPYSKHGHQLY